MLLTSRKLACYGSFFRLTFFAACLSVAWAEAQSIIDKHPFTVQDSIETSYIIDPVASTIIEIRDTQPVGSPIFSPDRKHFLLISQRGILQENHLEATIWLFDQAAVGDYVTGKSPTKPAPRAIARFSAPGNMPAISNVRWLDSSQVAFLAKDRSPYQQLFIARIDRGSPHAITPNNEYVSAYDISGNVVAYTSLIPPEPAKSSEDDIVDVTGKNIYTLLFSRPRAIEDVDEEQLQTYPSALHILRNGKELPVTFRSGGGRLRLFIPTLSLSPDGRWLITVAPVARIPGGWEAYEPNSKWDVLRLRQDNAYAIADENPWKASQYVLIDVQSGDVSPLVDAPAGRGLIFLAPTKAFWLEDSQRAILTNTFLPVNKDSDQKERTTSPAVVVANIREHTLRPICFLEQTLPPSERLNVENVLWGPLSHQITIVYAGNPGSKTPRIEHYKLRPDDSWEQTVSSIDGPPAEVSLSVEQNLDHPPVLVGRAPSHAEQVLIWDPNPQLNRIILGKVTRYSWNDKFGNKRRGLLALPPDYDPHIRYPLVIQPYGYDPDRFFADGAFTTGYGGRALAAKGIVVLQMETLMTHYRLPDEGSFQVEGFKSAINQLAKDGFVDPGHVGILGFSYTCFHVLQAITHQPDLFEAALITDGVNTSYMQYLLATDHGVVQEQFEQTIGAKPFGRGLLQWYGSSPGFNFDMTLTPLLISALESGQLLEQWENYSCLRKLNKPVDMVWLRKENAPHILVQPAQRFLSQQMTVDWFCFWLKGLEEPDPAKTAQYRRWRELRRLRDEGRSASTVANN